MKPFFNRPIRILLWTNALVLVSGAMLAPIYALYVEGIGGDLMDASLTGGIFALAAGCTSIIAGKYADKVRRKDYVMIIGALIMSLGFFFLTKVETILGLFAIQSLIGFGQAIYYPPYDALYSLHTSNSKAASTWAAWESMDYFVTAGGAVLGGYIANTVGFSALFVMMGVVCIIPSVYLYCLPRQILNS